MSQIFNVRIMLASQTLNIEFLDKSTNGHRALQSSVDGLCIDPRFEFDDGYLKKSANFKSAENVQSSNVVEFECELRHILNVIFA